MTPTDMNSSIMQQERLRNEQVAEAQMQEDTRSFKVATILEHDPLFGLWIVQVGDAKVKATSLTNAGLANGQTVYYYKAEGQAYGYIKTMPVG